MWIIITVLILAAIMLIFIYNRLVGLRQNCKQGWADIDAQLRQRHDLIPNLVETVKGYAAHESKTLDAVVAARNSAISARGPDRMAQAEAGLSGALKGLFALAENYPDLKANTNFLSLQGEMADVEDKLAASRRAFNAAAADYNAARESFPAVLFASGFGFTAQEFWELNADDRPLLESAPKVEF
ncbi:LemA family protein [Sphingorhabdus arenilitoris]|uniref:LemA family protein n=1 Tax=Sphingorhabdus arenilitoris TaxID=1490041 RepID=A0ABV8REH2_9SPHN